MRTRVLPMSNAIGPSFCPLPVNVLLLYDSLLR